MQREKIVTIINQFLTEEFEIDESALVPEALLIQDLGIESLDFVDIVVIIEQEFGFKVTREEMVNVKTLDDMYNYIAERA
ncbi:MAG: acyl carrier protein [Bacteroidales bacterium]|jgi:acyl carrier protein|nr:acyl carrier protein [Bacteroidales bacterium]HBG87493.1 acyl carrier protein [Marinilabiliaceae bacterium]HBX89048.1 acyl carrier protein [Marinilabiliaceae bacterium]